MNENEQGMELIRSMTAVEIKLETAREELSSRNYSKVPLSRITALGVGFEPLTAALQQVLSGGEAVSGIYRVTIPAGTHLAQFKGSTDFLGAALGAGRIEAQARLNPLMFSPAAVGTLLMAATLANVDKKLDAIQETQQEMLDFLKAKERSALMGDLEFLADVFNNYKYIKSQLLQAAVEQAYRSTLLTGRFPSCVIYLKLSPAAVDVNVHPAKTEVKFSDEKRVFDAVHYAVLGALEQRRQPGEALVPDVPATLEPTEAEDKNIEPSPAKLAHTGYHKGRLGLRAFPDTAQQAQQAAGPGELYDFLPQPRPLQGRYGTRGPGDPPGEAARAVCVRAFARPRWHGASKNRVG